MTTAASSMTVMDATELGNVVRPHSLLDDFVNESRDS